MDGNNNYTYTYTTKYTNTLYDMDIDEYATNPYLNNNTYVDNINGFTYTYPLKFNRLTYKTPTPYKIPLQITPTTTIVKQNIPITLQMSNSQKPYQFQ